MIQHHHHQHEYGKSFLPHPHLLICLIFTMYESLSWLDSGPCPFSFSGLKRWRLNEWRLYLLSTASLPQISNANVNIRNQISIWDLNQNMTEHCNGNILQNIWRLNEWRLCLLSTASLPQIFKANDNILHPISDLQNRTWQLSTWEIFDWISGYMKGRLICYPMHYLFVLDSNGQRFSSKILFELARTWQSIAKKILETIDTNDWWKYPNLNPGRKIYFPSSFNTKLWATSQISKPLPNFPLICKKNVLIFWVPKY